MRDTLRRSYCRSQRAGVSVKAHYIFEYIQAHGSFDGLSDSGTHISKLGCKCRAWTTAHQCDIASSTLASIDAAFKPTLNTSNLHPRQHSFNWDWTILCSGMSIVMGSPPPLVLRNALYAALPMQLVLIWNELSH